MEGGGHNVSVQGVSVTLQCCSLTTLSWSGCCSAVVVYSRCPRADSNLATAHWVLVSRVSAYLTISASAASPSQPPSLTPATLLCVELAACVHSVLWHYLQLLSPWSRLLFEMRNWRHRELWRVGHGPRVCSVTFNRMANIMQNMAQSPNIPRVSSVFSFWSEDVLLLFIYS